MSTLNDTMFMKKNIAPTVAVVNMETESIIAQSLEVRRSVTINSSNDIGRKATNPVPSGTNNRVEIYSISHQSPEGDVLSGDFVSLLTQGLSFLTQFVKVVAYLCSVKEK